MRRTEDQCYVPGVRGKMSQKKICDIRVLPSYRRTMIKKVVFTHEMRDCPIMGDERTVFYSYNCFLKNIIIDKHTSLISHRVYK